MLTALFIIGGILILAYHGISMYMADSIAVGFDWYLIRKIIAYVISLTIALMLFFTHDTVGIFLIVIYSGRWIWESISNHFIYQEQKEIWESQFFENEEVDEENSEEEKAEETYFLIEKEQLKNILESENVIIDENGKECYKIEFIFDSDDVKK